MKNLNIAKASNLGYVGSVPGAKDAGRDSDSWYTPAKYMASVRTAMGGTIDLDPFSAKTANNRVGATNYITAKQDALKTNWRRFKADTCFMNPPYSSALIKAATDRFILMFNAQAFKRGIVLVNNATDTKWFSTLMSEAVAVCFTDHRIAFENDDGKSISGNTRGQCFLFFTDDLTGKDTARFKAEFDQHGHVMIVRGAVV